MSDRNQGRKPLSPTGELMRPRHIRMTDGEWSKFKDIGGPAWLRDKIKRASLPTTSKE